MKKRIIVLALFLSILYPASAVLKEANLSKTLGVLRMELEMNYKELKRQMARFYSSNEMQHQKIIQIMQNSDQTALMLYSQKYDYTFDLTYACHEATQQYMDFQRDCLPYDKIKQRIEMEIERYDALIGELKDIPPSLNPRPAMKAGDRMMPPPKRKAAPFALNKQGLADRMACLEYATVLRNNLVTLRASILQDTEHYQRVSQKLGKVSRYAMQRYNQIQHSIFINGEDSYFTILSRFAQYIRMAKVDVTDKYKDFHQPGRHSEWRGPVVIGLTAFVIFYLIIATILSYVFIRWAVPKRFRTPGFLKRRKFFIAAAGVLIFAVSVMIAEISMKHNFIIMASSLLVEFAWLWFAILVSLLVRVEPEKILNSIRVYTPIMVMAFVVIVFRIIFIPNTLVNLIFPPILLLFTIWQFWVTLHRKSILSRSDVFYTWISLVVMCVSCFAAWIGYVLLAVQIFIWWIFQLAAIQTITCLYDLLSMYENKFINHRIERYKKLSEKKSRIKYDDEGKSKKKSLIDIAGIKQDGAYIQLTWFYDLVVMAIVPVLGVMSIFACIYWASDVFDLTATCRDIFFFNFINEKAVIQLSLFKLSLVGGCWFVFRYLNYAIRSFYHKYRKALVTTLEGKPNFTLADNVIALLVWGIYFVSALALLQVPKSGISIVMAGLATGMGFAMKDLLENFFYGISLMTGRVRVGDYIECDGILGKVDSITYQSTQLVTLDGSIIAFLNSALFNKNFKNLTRNHSYELAKVPIGVAYGANIENVRKILLSAVNQLVDKVNADREIVSRERDIKVVVSDFGDNSVNLLLTYWVLVEDKIGFNCQVNEVIYNTLNEHHIEIPFPQRDIYIRKLPDKPEQNIVD